MPYYINADNLTLDNLKIRITESDLVPSRRKLLEDIESNFDKLGQRGIITLTDLRKSIKNPNSIEQLAKTTKIENEYLILLRREIESYFPKPCKLSAFDWLEDEQIRKLEREGFKNAALLYEAFELPSKRQDIIASIELEKTFAEEIYALVDLTRIQWVSPTFSRVLVDAGYKSAKLIAKANAEELHEAVEKTNKEARYFKGNIGIRDIARLIKAAAEVVSS